MGGRVQQDLRAICWSFRFGFQGFFLWDLKVYGFQGLGA